jgi:hypothetical protein
VLTLGGVGQVVSFEREVKIGSSRFDFVVSHGEGDRTIMEVKNVSFLFRFCMLHRVIREGVIFAAGILKGSGDRRPHEPQSAKSAPPFRLSTCLSCKPPRRIEAAAEEEKCVSLKPQEPLSWAAVTLLVTHGSSLSSSPSSPPPHHPHHRNSLAWYNLKHQRFSCWLKPLTSHWPAGCDRRPRAPPAGL